jgi:hypothetical protein
MTKNTRQASVSKRLEQERMESVWEDDDSVILEDIDVFFVISLKFSNTVRVSELRRRENTRERRKKKEKGMKEWTKTGPEPFYTIWTEPVHSDRSNSFWFPSPLIYAVRFSVLHVSVLDFLDSMHLHPAVMYHTLSALGFRVLEELDLSYASEAPG